MTFMVFEYLTVLISVVVGLSLAHFLTHLVRIINLRKEVVVSWVQLTWALTITIWTVAFWWFTFALNRIETWSLGLFLFVLLYAIFLYVLMALLFPGDDLPGTDYREQFMSNQKWFYGVLIAFLLYDIGDYVVKMEADLSIIEALPYAAFIGSLVAGSVVALFNRSLLYHRAFAGFALALLLLMSATTLDPLAG